MSNQTGQRKPSARRVPERSQEGLRPAPTPEEQGWLQELSNKLEAISEFSLTEDIWQDVRTVLTLTKITSREAWGPWSDLSVTDILFVLQTIRQDLWKNSLEDHGRSAGPLALLAQQVRKEEIRLADEVLNHYLSRSAKQLGLSGHQQNL